MGRPTSGLKPAVKALKSVSSFPSSSSGVLRRTDKMACVAHALLMTYKLSVPASAVMSASHLVRKEEVIALNAGSIVLLLPPLEEEDQAIDRLELLKAVLIHSV